MGRIVFFILFLGFGLCARPQPFPSLRWTKLTERDGLSCDKATAVGQDTSGIIWVSTSNGLNRYDGYGFARFFSNLRDSTSLLDNDIEAVYPDHKGALWLITATGVCRFNTATQKTTRFESGGNTATPFRIFDDSQVWFDEKDDPYVVSPWGLYHFTDTTHYTEINEHFAPHVFQQHTATHYKTLVRDEKGGLWSFQQNMIYKIDPVSKQVLQFWKCPGDFAVYSILFDSHNRCWVGTWNHGVYRFDPSDGRFSLIPSEHENNVIKQGVEWELDGRRFIIFATNKSDLLFFDEETDHYRTYRPIHAAQYGTPFVDRQNILWIPTTSGLFYVNSYGRLFDILPAADPASVFVDSGNMATPYCMREEKSGYWVASRYRGGVSWYDRQWRLIRHWPDIVDSVGTLLKEEIATKQEAYDFKQVGNEMFITTEWGMMIMDLKTLRRTLIRCPWTKPIMRLRTIAPDSRATIPDSRTPISDSPRKWWVRSFDQGVFVFDPAARRFTRHYMLADKCPTCEMPQANYMLCDHAGRVFVTTNGGFYKYFPQADSFFRIHPAGPPLGNSLVGMAEDGTGLIWIGNDKGISAYNADSDKIVRTVWENNSIGTVFRICIDSQQNAWFRSSAGYWCWLRKRDKAIQFKFSLGLPDNDEGLFYTTSDGNVYAGGAGAMIRWHTDWLMHYSVTSEARIMEAMVNDIPIPFTRGANGEKRLQLRPQENNLRVSFDINNYDIPENNLYYYRLQPGSGNWTQLDNGRLSFNDLHPGQYELTVRGANKLTGVFTPTDRLIFVIAPYWYQATWFRALVLLAGVALIIFLVRRRITNIRRESAFRQKIADTQLQALRAQMNPHFIFNSLNSIENFIMKNEKWLASDYLNKFARLIRMILSSSRNELVPFPKDLEALQLYVDLELLRFNRKFCYRPEIDPALLHGDYRVPSLLIQPYVENAIIHGIGLSDKPGLFVRVIAFLDGECIHYIIEDNGIGRTQANLIKQKNRPHHKSIGLNITEDRIHIFSHQQGSAGSVTITDVLDHQGAAAGTKVEVIIKAV